MHAEAAVSRLDGPKKYEEWDRTRIRMRDLGDKVLNYCRRTAPSWVRL